MKWKLGYGWIGLIVLLLTAGILWYEMANAPLKVPVELSYSSLPLLAPEPELEGLQIPLNSATPQELEQLPGIGPAKAEDIWLYVQKYGPVLRYEQLLEIKGIGEKTLEQIQPYLILD